MAQGGFETGKEIYILNKFLNEGYIYDTVILVYCLNDINDLIPESADIHKEIRRTVNQEGFFVRHSYFVNTYYYRLQAILNPNISNYYGFVKKGYDSELWEQQKERLFTFFSICKNNKINLLVVTFPFLNVLGKDYEYAAVHDQLGEFRREFDVPHLDLLSSYAEYAPEDVTVSPFDAHPNELAHGIAAQAIMTFLEESQC